MREFPKAFKEDDTRFENVVEAQFHDRSSVIEMFKSATDAGHTSNEVWIPKSMAASIENVANTGARNIKVPWVSSMIGEICNEYMETECINTKDAPG